MRQMPVAHPFAVLACLVVMGAASGRGQRVQVESFPAVRAFPVFLADGLAHQLSLHRVTDNREWIGAIGGSVPLVEVRAGSLALQAGVGATTFSRIIKTPGHITVYTIDYRVDFPVDLCAGDWAARVALGHVSAHFADDGIEILKQSSISYVRDYVTFAGARRVPVLRSTVYASADWNFHYEPVAGPWILQAGIQGGELDLAGVAHLYGAIDLKARQNAGWGSTQSYQVGLRFLEKGRMGLRLAYTFRTGHEERGQMFAASESRHLVGAAIDF